jgi:hypothetical protein
MNSHRPRSRRIAALALAGAPAAHRRQLAGATTGARPGDFGQRVGRRNLATRPSTIRAPRAPRVRRPGDNRDRRLGCTIARHIDEVLPVVMSSAALLVALDASALFCFASIRRRPLAAPTDRIVRKRRRGATERARAGACGVTR